MHPLAPKIFIHVNFIQELYMNKSQFYALFVWINILNFVCFLLRYKSGTKISRAKKDLNPGSSYQMERLVYSP